MFGYDCPSDGSSSLSSLQQHDDATQFDSSNVNSRTAPSRGYNPLAGALSEDFASMIFDHSKEIEELEKRLNKGLRPSLSIDEEETVGDDDFDAMVDVSCWLNNHQSKLKEDSYEASQKIACSQRENSFPSQPLEREADHRHLQQSSTSKKAENLKGEEQKAADQKSSSDEDEEEEEDEATQQHYSSSSPSSQLTSDLDQQLPSIANATTDLRISNRTLRAINRSAQCGESILDMNE